MKNKSAFKHLSIQKTKTKAKKPQQYTWFPPKEQVLVVIFISSDFC
jgi:hypothetical protein